ncbi:hypothetical protein ACHAWF_000825 [Thalassiosira exigua]
MPYRRRDRRDGHSGAVGAAAIISSSSAAAAAPSAAFTAAGLPTGRRPSQSSSDCTLPPRRPPQSSAYAAHRGHTGPSSPSSPSHRSPRSVRSAAGPADGRRRASTPAAAPQPQASPPSPPAWRATVVDPPRPPPPRSADELSFAKRTLRKLARDSRLFPADGEGDERRVRTVGEKELDIGEVVGRGGFCEVRFSDLRRPRACDAIGEERRRYAMKYMSPAKSASSRVFQRGLTDLATEACFLSLLRHEHVIGLHYIGEGSLEENYGCDDLSNGRYEEIVTDAQGNLKLRRRSPPRLSRTEGTERLFGYFLLLDPLHETLTDRIEKSYVPREMLRHSQSEGGDEGRESCVSRLRLAERLDVLVSVASALRYLHEE